eukprot:CCRYP_013497-RA/>CCRYP_013497-RA protein AED:0.00 eAED:0.00 QI:40/1/0.5/1/0/0/2/0/53
MLPMHLPICSASKESRAMKILHNADQIFKTLFIPQTCHSGPLKMQGLSGVFGQ